MAGGREAEQTLLPYFCRGQADAQTVGRGVAKNQFVVKRNTLGSWLWNYSIGICKQLNSGCPSDRGRTSLRNYWKIFARRSKNRKPNLGANCRTLKWNQSSMPAGHHSLQRLATCR